MSFFKKLVDPAGLTSGRGSKAFTDPANLRGRVGQVLGQAMQQRQQRPQGGPSGMLQGIAARRAQLGGGAPAAAPAAAPAGVMPGGGQVAGGVRMYSDGGKVFDRKPNGKRC